MFTQFRKNISNKQRFLKEFQGLPLQYTNSLICLRNKLFIETLSRSQSFPFVLAKLQELFCIDFLLCIEIFLHFSQLSENVQSVLTKTVFFFPDLSCSSTTFLSTRKYKHFLFILIYCIFIAQIDVCSAVRLYPLCLSKIIGL